MVLIGSALVALFGHFWHPVSVTVFYALSHGSLYFVLHGSFNNHLFQRIWLAVEESLPIRKWLKKLPWRAKLRVPCERAWKFEAGAGVKSELAICLRSLYEKTVFQEKNPASLFSKHYSSWPMSKDTLRRFNSMYANNFFISAKIVDRFIEKWNK